MINVPPQIKRVCATLTDAGYQAVCVGGAVRDALMGRKPHDWDVATSALPSVVQELFPKTLPTGLQHGTVTVMDNGLAIEVTTFRTEGKYDDARRPTQVTFGVTLHEDLSRRDLTVNAIAYDPVTGEYHDPFKGQQDIEDKRLRAVGNPVDRFTEDGLRVMRAIRFSATLGFQLDVATEDALYVALPSLAKVSIERVREELQKLLNAPSPGRALRTAFRCGIVKTVLPELQAVIGNGDTAEDIIARVTACGLNGRTAALFSYVENVDAMLRRLKYSNEDRESIVKLCRVGSEIALDAPRVRQLLASAGKNIGPTVVELWEAHAANALKEIRLHMVRMGNNVLDKNDPLSVGDLVVGGSDLIALGIPVGKELGATLKYLLHEVLKDPSLNKRESLLKLASR